MVVLSLGLPRVTLTQHLTDQTGDVIHLELEVSSKTIFDCLKNNPEILDRAVDSADAESWDRWTSARLKSAPVTGNNEVHLEPSDNSSFSSVPRGDDSPNKFNSDENFVTDTRRVGEERTDRGTEERRQKHKRKIKPNRFKSADDADRSEDWTPQMAARLGDSTERSSRKPCTRRAAAARTRTGPVETQIAAARDPISNTSVSGEDLDAVARNGSKKRGRPRKTTNATTNHTETTFSKNTNEPQSIRCEDNISTVDKERISANGDERRAAVDDRPSRSFDCDACDKTFATSNALRSHRTTVHSSARVHKCAQCDKSFKTKGTLTTHERIHTGDKPYACDVCDRRFTQASNLRTHKLMHTGVKPYVCDDCGAAFRQKGDLTSHKLSHTGERPFLCSFCGKGFGKNYLLKQHVFLHTGDRPHTCALCDKTYARRESLRLHMRLHRGIKPYKCDQCERAFTNNSALKDHRRYHTGDKPWACPVCPSKFIHRSHLRAHFKRQHVDKEAAKSLVVGGAAVAVEQTDIAFDANNATEIVLSNAQLNALRLVGGCIDIGEVSPQTMDAVVAPSTSITDNAMYHPAFWELQQVASAVLCNNNEMQHHQQQQQQQQQELMHNVTASNDQNYLIQH
ncbi:uncharacterized protein LOC141910828 [Tubulanus polymorphus]|uniref:uncharacterized protein LOC141910828 n=1 Tax=Tubulanus polymorphus TaxID=672921 RepID=UPI003DA6A8F7